MRRIAFLCLLSVVLAMPVSAQIALNGQTTQTMAVTTGAPSVTFSHTTPTLGNRILLVAVHLNVDASTATTISGVTYNGTALTFVNAINDGSNDTRTELWVQANPATGAHSVVVTAQNITGTVRGVASATTYVDVDSTAGTTGTAVGNSANPTSNIASAVGNLVVDFASVRQTTNWSTTSQTRMYEVASRGTPDATDVLALASQATGAATVTMAYTVSTSRRWGKVTANLVPATADVSITQANPTPDPVLVSGTTSFSFTVTNNSGTFTSNNVNFTDTLPAGFTLIGNASTTLGSCTAGTTNCALGNMAPGATATITFSATAPATAGNRTNTGQITTGTSDPTAGNNSASATVFVQNPACPATPGKDGAVTNITGVVNGYWPGSANAAAAATSITVGARSGAAVSIASGDLLVVMQMQDSTINANNDERYGDGTGTAGVTTGNGSGSTNLNNAGHYEYVVATNAVAIGAGGGTITFTGSGGSGGLIYNYTNAAATGTQGQRTFQVIRVPQYTTASLGAALTALDWNGSVGGVLAIDVAGTLTLNSQTVSVNGKGFRGAAVNQDVGGGGTNADYVNTDANNAHGTKGEGIAGTPRYMYDSATNTVVNGAAATGYPNGDFARGAPGNAGGGGTDGNPVANDQNSGGGGGGNGGAGGLGGNTWNSNLAVGGFGGAAFSALTGRVILGGGGGGGSRNNDPGVTGASSGADGGGTVLMRIGNISGTATITANGSDAFTTTANDGGGGGGAGGSIVILARSGGLTGLTLQANGGRGGDAWRNSVPAGVALADRHGPGGGGAGGVIITSSVPTSTSVTGGAAGLTTTLVAQNYGATSGSAGVVTTTATFDEVPGTRSGTTCSPDLEVFISDSPDPVIAGNNLTYTISGINNGPYANAAAGVQITIATPPGTTFVSMTPPAGWTCTTPSIGGTGTTTCTKTTGLNSGVATGNFTFIVNVGSTTADGTTLTGTANIIAPASTPDPVPSNNTASTTTAVIRRVDVSIVKTASPDPTAMQGDTLTYTLVVANNGPSRASSVSVSDPLPSGFSFVSVSPSGPTCTFSSPNVTCNLGNLDSGASTNITITGTVTVNTTTLTNTATVTQTETDLDTSNNSSTVNTVILAPTVAHFTKIDAVQDSKGKVVISWTTSFEAENLGFNVYREGNSGREKINKQPIAGSALFTSNSALASGRAYRWKDKLENPGEFTQYYVEDVDLHGNRTLHGPVTPVISSSVPDESSTDTIADLGSNGGILLSPRGIGAPAYPVITSTKSQLAQQYDLAKQTAIKFMVTTEGWYRVTKNEIVAAGYDPGTNSRGLALFAEGIEQPLTVDDGGDGKFDATDAIEFYGIGIDTPSSGARAYWFTADKGKGLRVKADKTTARAAAAASTPFTFQRTERTLFFTALVNNGDRDNFFGPILSSWASTPQALTVENLDRTGAAASLDLVLQGATDGAHVIALSMNGASLGNVTFADQQRLVQTVSVPLSMLVDGANTLELLAVNGDMDISVIESLRLTYPHRLAADDDALKVSVASASPVAIDGFTSNKIRAFDVTDPTQPVEVTVAVTGTGPYRASLVAPDAGGTRAILVLGSSRIAPPAQLVPSRPSTWNDKKNSADMVIISARAFMSAATPLKTRRDAEGISTTIVDVQDLYDEFGFGERGPGAIREFITKSREWKKAPRYVLLLGDASSDPRNYFGLGTFDFVPTKLIPTRLIKTSSDDWFADVAGTGIPSVAIGRLPARTLADAQLMINKIATRNVSGAWANNVAFIASPTDEFSFEDAATSLAPLLPAGVTPVNVFTGHLADPHTTVVNTMNAGQLLVNYIGHGTVDLWLAGSFGGADATAMTNGSRLPVVIGMTCLTAYFQDVFQTSLSESMLLAPNGGAVAVWTSTGLTEPDQQHLVSVALFKQLFGPTPTLGDAFLKAKAATEDPDVRHTWILLGDPSMKLR